jgi:hypothetical protein
MMVHHHKIKQMNANNDYETSSFDDTTIDDRTFLAFVRFRGLTRYTCQNGWVQMQVASSDSFHALLQSTLRSLHVAGVINDVEISDIGSLSLRVRIQRRTGYVWED